MWGHWKPGENPAQESHQEIHSMIVSRNGELVCHYTQYDGQNPLISTIQVRLSIGSYYMVVTAAFRDGFVMNFSHFEEVR